MSDQDILNFDLFGNTYRFPRPHRLEITEFDRQQFTQAREELNRYHGLTEQLQAAFEKFIQIQSLPLFDAGLASFFITYSFLYGFEYDKAGLTAAYSWLEEAQEIAPNEKGVLLARIDYYIAQKEYQPCRELLEKGLQLYPNDFDFHKRHISFLVRQGTVRQIEKAIQATHELKLTDEQKESLSVQEADAYLLKRQWPKAIKSYKRATKMQPDNPWLWHNLSIAQYESKNGFTAYMSNRKALSLMNFEVARNMQKRIRMILFVQVGAILLFILLVVFQILRL